MPQNSLHDLRLVDDGNDAHGFPALGTEQWVGVPKLLTDRKLLLTLARLTRAKNSVFQRVTPFSAADSNVARIWLKI